jgi:ubiquitin-conjugating enzyme E2 J1
MFRLSSSLVDSSLTYLRSRDWVCPRCRQTNLECLPDLTPLEDSLSPQVSPQEPPMDPPSSTAPPLLSDMDPVNEVSRVEPGPETMSSPSHPPVEADTPGSPKSFDSSGEESVNNHPSGIAVPNSSSRHPRPPLFLDTAICVLLVLVFALICRRIL